MAVMISTSTDAFEETRRDAHEAASSSFVNVRRPLRGIQVKRNTYATLRVRTAAGRSIDLFDSSSNRSSESNDNIGVTDSYANFLIQSINEERAEKQQIIETFGEDYVYFFGERPRFLAVNGVLLNTADFNWKSEFWTNYDLYLRGTKLVEQNARLYFYFDDTVVEGYMIGARTTAGSDTPHMMPFQFQIFITNYAILSTVGSMFIEESDTGQRKSMGMAVPPEMTNEKLAGDAARGAGGLTNFLTKTAGFLQDASFTVQRELEKIKNTLYGRHLGLAGGIGALATAIELVPPVENQGEYGRPPTYVPIHTMWDEYVERGGEISTAAKRGMLKEESRIQLMTKSPAELEAKVRAEFEKYGIDTSPPSAALAILGRGAFAAMQYAAPFALAKVPGKMTGKAKQVQIGLGGLP